MDKHEQVQEQLDDVLRPHKPIDREALLAGRSEQLIDVTTAIRLTGRHALIYGDRGVGKTSLAATAQTLQPQEAVAVRTNCGPDTDWSSLWESVAAEVADEKLSLPDGEISDDVRASLIQAVELLNRGPATVAQTLPALKLLGKHKPAVIVIDEFDKVEDDSVGEGIANLVKTLADKAVPVTIIIVGVAETVNDLLVEHESIRRNLQQIHMPRLSAAELEAIIATAETHLKVSCSKEVRERVTLVSRGLPHYTHLIAWHCFDQALLARKKQITLEDLREAQGRAARGLEEDLGRKVQLAVHSGYPGARYWDVCVAAASAPTDRSGYFQMRDLRATLEARTTRSYANFAFKKHLDEFCGERGPLLEWEERGRGSTVYRFLDPLVPPYILILEASTSGLEDQVYGQLALFSN